MLKKIWNFIISKRDLIYIPIIILGCIFISKQCHRNDDLKHDVQRLENNILAMNDTLTQYVDDNGRIIAERRAFQFTEKELRDSINLLKTKNREYLSYINSIIGIRDTIEIPTYIERPDTIYYADQGNIRFNKSDTFGKSSRELHVSIPYHFDDKLYTGVAEVYMYHNIYVESMIERNTKTGETYVKLISDYPYLKFNDGMGVVISNSTSYEKSMRKTKGIGLSIGPSVGLGYDMLNRRIVPTVGIGLTIGFNYTPSFLQW